MLSSLGFYFPEAARHLDVDPPGSFVRGIHHHHEHVLGRANRVLDHRNQDCVLGDEFAQPGPRRSRCSPRSTAGSAGKDCPVVTFRVPELQPGTDLP